MTSSASVIRRLFLFENPHVARPSRLRGLKVKLIPEFSSLCQRGNINYNDTEAVVC